MGLGKWKDISNPWSVVLSGLLFYADGLTRSFEAMRTISLKIKRFSVQKPNYYDM